MLKTTMRACGSAARIRRVNSNPETPGRPMSTTVTSGFCATKTARPVSASRASTTSMSPSPASIAAQPETMIGWSSTIRTRIIGRGSKSPGRCRRQAAKHCRHLGPFVKSHASLENWPMLRRLSLRLRLSLLLGVVLALGLALGVGLLVLHAGARVRAEADGATRLARELIEATLTRLDAAPRSAGGDRATSRRRAAAAPCSRHARRRGDARSGGRRPRAAVVHPARAAERRRDAESKPAAAAAIMIAPNPADEIAEIWQEIVWLAIGGAGIAVAAFALVSLAVSRTLRPVATLAEGLKRLERGEHSMRVPADGVSGIRHHRRTNQRARRNAATARRRKSQARAAHDPCAGRRAKRHRPRSA